MMKQTILIPVAALLAGGVGGFIAGKGSDAASETPSPALSEQRAQRTTARASSSLEPSTTRRGATRASSIEDVYREPGTSNRIQALMAFYADLTPEQLEEEAAKLSNLPMSERMMASFLLFGRWAEVDPLAAMQYSNTMGFGGGFVRPTILQSWASLDPENAAKYFADNPGQFASMGRGPMGGSSAGVIAGEWARQDPRAALEWANSLTGNDKSQALESVIGEVAKTDVKSAIEMLGSLSADEQSGAISIVAARYGAENIDDAKAWIAGLPADQQNAALEEAIRGLSGTDPQAAAKEVAAMPAGDAKDRAIPHVVGPLAREDASAAAQLIASQQDTGLKQRSIQNLMPIWTAQDPQAALSFAQAQAEPELKNQALSSYVWSNTSAQPKELLDVAATITDDRTRARAAFPSAQRWLQSDPSAAAEYIRSSDAIPERAKERLIESGGSSNRGGGRWRR